MFDQKRKSTRQRVVAVTGLAALVAMGVPAVGATVDGSAANDWVGASTMVGGTSQVDAGEWIYQDFVYDDYGADIGRGSSNIVSLAPTTGDFRYPAGSSFAGNAADIVEVRARPVGDDLAVRVSLNTIIDAASPAVGIAIDTGTGTAKAWPAAAGVSSTWDHFVTIGGGNATLHTPSGSSALPAVIDVAANTIDVTVPGLGVAPSLSLVAGAGLWDRTAHTWMAGSPGGVVPGTFNSLGPSLVRVFDLAFNSHAIEPRKGNWMEDEQAGALFSGDVTAFRQQLDLDLLRSGTDQPFQFTPGNYYNGLFRSVMDLGEGIGASFPQYRGSLQPYGLWIPESYDPDGAPSPLMFLLHSLNSHHNQYSGGATGESYQTFYEQLLDRLGAIAVTPLDRGPDGWYRNEGLVDALEVLDDANARFSIDQDRTWITGYSMGGYGTYRIGTLLPDRFAGAVSWAGVPTDSDRLDNMMWVPTQIIHGTNDELVPITGVRAQAARFEALGHEYSFFEHPGQDHLSFVFMEHWTREVDWLAPRSRVANPPTVSLAVNPSMWTTNVSAERRATLLGHLDDLGVDFTSAYWVRNVSNRSTGTATVRATSLAQEARRVNAIPYEGVSTDLAPSPYLIKGQNRSLANIEASNGLDMQLTGVAEAGFALADAGLDDTGPLDLQVTSDGPSVVRLHGTYAPGTTVLDAAGEAVSFTVFDGTVSIDVSDGTTELTVAPAAPDQKKPKKPKKHR